MATKIVLWRHGQTDYNIQGRVQGQVDIPLNNTGLEQVEVAAKNLARLDPERIICSDLERARQTAQALAQQTGLAVEIDKRLRERAFGEFEGLNAQEMQTSHAKQWDEWKKTGECPRAGVESRAIVGDRVKKAVIEAADKTEGVVVAVSHGSALTQGLVSLLGLDPVTWQGIRGLDNSHWCVVIPSLRPPKWRIAEHNVGPVDLPGVAFRSLA